MFRRIKRSDLVKSKEFFSKNYKVLPIFLQSRTSRKQAGIASIVVVSVLVVVMSLVAIGFSKLMNRSLQQSANSAISSAANYAARSAVNDAIAYAKENPAEAVTDCNALIGSGQLKDAAKLSDDTKYTCLLINPTPEDLVYQKLPPLSSQVIKMTTSAPVSGGSVMFSWESYDRSFDQLPSGQTFYNEKKWSLDKYEPVLRVSLYPIGAGGSLDSARSNSKTYFFYPNPKTNDTVNTVAYGSEGLQKIECGKNNPNTGNFKGSADYNCNVIINNLAAADYYYVRLTPIYNQTNVKIKANDSGNNVLKFTGVQSVIDATAKSGNAVKRLEARIDSSGIATGRDYNISPDENAIPEFTLRSSNQICKRLDVSGGSVAVDPTSAAYCNLKFEPPPPPPGPSVSLTANPESINSGQSSTLTWTSNNTTSCSATWTSSTAVNGSQSVSPNSSTTYSITCSSPSGDANDSASITVDGVPPPAAPSVSLAANPSSITAGQSSTLTWTSNNTTSCSATWTSSTAVNGSQPVSPGSSSSYTITCSGPGGNASDNASITVNGVPPPPPSPPQPPPPSSASSPPDCWIDNHDPPVGWGCTNSHSGGSSLQRIDAGSGCYYYYVSDWNYQGMDSAATNIFCPTGAPPQFSGNPSLPLSDCGPGQIGDLPNNCIDADIYYQSLGACQPPYIGIPTNRNGWYGNPINWAIVPGCSLPQYVIEPQPTVSPPPSLPPSEYYFPPPPSSPVCADWDFICMGIPAYY